MREFYTFNSLLGFSSFETTYQIAEFNFEEEEEEIPEELLEDPEIKACYLYAKFGRLDRVRREIGVCSNTTTKTYIRKGILKLLYLAFSNLQQEGSTSNNVIIEDIKNMLQEVVACG